MVVKDITFLPTCNDYCCLFIHMYVHIITHGVAKFIIRILVKWMAKLRRVACKMQNFLCLIVTSLFLINHVRFGTPKL